MTEHTIRWAGVVVELGITVVFALHEWRWRAHLPRYRRGLSVWPWLVKLPLAFEPGIGWSFLRTGLGVLAIGLFALNQRTVRRRAEA